MVFQPSTRKEIYDTFVNRVEQRSEGIQGPFEDDGIVYTLLWAKSGYMVIYEHALLASQLSGWIDYAGGPIDSEDLEKLGLDRNRTQLDLLNYFMNDQDLDNLAAQNTVTRGPGSKATGEVTFTLSEPDAAFIRAGTIVKVPATQSQPSLSYEVTEDIDPNASSDTVKVEVQAVNIGPDYNVGAGSITEFENNPVGVESVTHDIGISGGELRESNEELRQRTKEAMVRNSLGGTVEGVIGGLQYLIADIESGDVVVDEDNLNVIVDGGTDFRVSDVIEDLRPLGINLTWSRPTIYTIDVECEVEGESLNVNQISDAISDQIASYGIGDDVDIYDVSVAIGNREPDVENASISFSSERSGEIVGDLTLTRTEKAVPGEINVTVS